jgi:uncharacterized membrane protein
LEWVFLIVLGIVWAIGTPIVALIALVRTSGLRDENARLAIELANLRRQIGEGAAPVAAPPAPAPVVEEAALPPPFTPEPAAEAPPAPTAPAPPAPAWQPPASQPADIGWERRLGARAFIWVGAVTLALAAIFLVRYSIEEGYLSPEVRVILAALFGFGLIAAAERVRVSDERVAQAMAAAGVAAIYGALFAAVGLYDMIPRPVAGIAALALTGFAIGVSLRHGILVAALAFVGGFASPAIIGGEPNTPVLFGYLLAIAAGTLAVIRHRGWWLLGWGVLAGAALWTVLWMLSLPSSHLASGPFELHWVGAFLVAVAGLFVWATWRRLGESENPPADVAALVWSALGVTGVLLLSTIVQDQGQQDAAWLALALHGAGVYALGRGTARFQYVAVLAPVLSLATLLLWWGSVHVGVKVEGWDDARFAWLTALIGGFYAAAAFALMWNAGRPGFWAALSVGAALTHFLLVWYTQRSVAPGTPWGLISIAIAVPFLVGAERLVHWRSRMAGGTEALGMLAAGVCFFIAAAIALELRREWITVAYAVELAAVAAIAARLDLHAMRRLCWPLLAVVVVRFVLNPEVLRYPLGLTPIFNWILWGYGLSIAAFVVGRHFLLATNDRALILAVEAAIALLAFVLATLEVRSLFQRDSMAVFDAGFMERSVYVLVWGAFALAALWTSRRRGGAMALSWQLSGGLALAAAVIVQVMVANPVSVTADVGSLPILNGLLLAYAAPAAMAFVGRRWLDRPDDRNARVATEIAGTILAFVYVSLEVRHFFDPGFARGWQWAEGIELYAYSFTWLLFGVGLLAVGFWRVVPALRHAGMALVCIVVAKVFLIDMAGLEGLLRVLSFLGLGAALLGLGYAYRRFGFDQPTEVTTRDGP